LGKPQVEGHEIASGERQNQLMKRLFLTLFLVLASFSPAYADGELDKLLTAFDKDRLARFDTIKDEALREARAGGDQADIKVLDAALAGTALRTSGDFDATGQWRCRVIKAGGMPPLVAYPWFKCSISDDGSGWFLRKTSGSQRTEGRFYTESDTRMVYVGAGHVSGEKPRNYGDDPKEDQVAVAERLGENRLVLQFPAPRYESKFDLLVMER
jgi:hypothetical protein